MKRSTAHGPLVLKEWGARLGDAYASGSGVNSPSAKVCSPRFEDPHLYDALSGRTLVDGRDCRTREVGDPRRQMTEHKRENAPAIGERIAHFATQISPTRHGLRIVRVDDAERPLLRLAYVHHNHSMVAAQLMSGELALPRHRLPVGCPPFYDYKIGHQYDAIQLCFALSSVLPLVKRRSETRE